MDFRYYSTSELVRICKRLLSIQTPNAEMSDDQIRRVMTHLGYMVSRGQPDIMVMLTLTAAEFPEFFNRYGLAQPN